MLSSSSSVHVQSQSNSFLKPFTVASQDFKIVHNPPAIFRTSLPRNPKPYSSKPTSSNVSIFGLPFSPTVKKLSLKSLASSTAADSFLADGDDPPQDYSKEKLGVVVKPLEKPRLVLKFIWMQKDIGIGLNQVIPGHGTIPLSPYYFWPRKDAWEELKVLLESKPWISQSQRIHLLNQATDIINLWQASGVTLS